MKLEFSQKLSIGLILLLLITTNTIKAQNNSSVDSTQQLNRKEFNFVTKTFWDILASGGVDRKQALMMHPSLKIIEMHTYKRVNKGFPTGFVFFQIKNCMNYE